MATKRLWRWRGIDVQGAPCQGMLWQTKRLEVLQHLQQQRVIPLAYALCGEAEPLAPALQLRNDPPAATCWQAACRWRERVIAAGAAAVACPVAGAA